VWGKAEDRWLSSDNQSDDNAAPRQKNKQEGLVIYERWYQGMVKIKTPLGASVFQQVQRGAQ
jgi:hypothetical protein